LEILVPEHAMMRDISIVTKKSTGLAKKSPQRNFLYELSKKNPPAELGPTSPKVGPNFAELTPDSVGVLYTGFQKKRTQRRSSGIAAKN